MNHGLLRSDSIDDITSLPTHVPYFTVFLAQLIDGTFLLCFLDSTDSTDRFPLAAFNLMHCPDG